MALDVKLSVFSKGYIHEKGKGSVEEFVKDSTFEELEKQSKTLFSRVNKRIRTLERNKNKVISPSYLALKRDRGDAPRFGTKGSYTNLQELQKEIAKALSFDNSETSTVQGAKAYTENLQNELNLANLDKDKITLIYDSLHALHERMPDVLYSGLLSYSEYLDKIIETDENLALDDSLEKKEQLEEIVGKAIDELTNKVSDLLGSGTDILSMNYDRLF